MIHSFRSVASRFFQHARFPRGSQHNNAKLSQADLSSKLANVKREESDEWEAESTLSTEGHVEARAGNWR